MTVGEQVLRQSVRRQRQVASADDTGAVLDADERAELDRLRRENAELRSERECLHEAVGLSVAERAAPPPSPQKITVLTAQGHVHEMMQQGDYAADLGRYVEAQDPNLFSWQPIGNWNAFPLPLGPECDKGVAEGIDLLTKVHPQGLVALCGFSQGAIVISRLFQWMCKDPVRKARFIGGVTFGNPMREQGSYVGTTDPGGHGIASSRLANTPKDIWRDYADPDDLYTSVEEPWGKYCTAIYDVAMYVDPRRIIEEVTKIIKDAPRELWPMLWACWEGIDFFALSKQLPHNQYELRQCAGTDRTYFDDAVRFMRELGAHHAAAASLA